MELKNITFLTCQKQGQPLTISCLFVFFLSYPGSGKKWDDTWEPAQQYSCSK